MSDKLIITHEYLTNLAGEAAFKRGLAYFEDGKVLTIKQRANKISADVEGTETYQVTLEWTHKQLDGACTVLLLKASIFASTVLPLHST